MSELVVVEQRRGIDDSAPWVREGGRRLAGRECNQRLIQLLDGLTRPDGVRAVDADAADAVLERTLGALHEPEYLEALARVQPRGEPVVMPELAPPGLEPDIPVGAGLVAAAREGVRTAISAAERTLGGARFTYAVCRPPGHHAGPAFLGGYCYLNNAAAAAQTLCEGGLRPVGILDLDLHYPNGTSAHLERIGDATLHSLHAAPVTNVGPGTVLPRVEGERVVAFERSPDPAAYVAEVARSLEALAARAAVLVVSLGYDTVAGDPHGGWDFEPAIFERIGALLAATELPVCVVQEGGYAIGALAECAERFARGLLGGEDG
jgi:acetoin utilization deacetylase AcuC-like enzyme